MKIADKKYVTLHPEDQSRWALDFSEFESIPTKTDYTLVSMGSHPDVLDAYDDIVLVWLELPNCLVLRDKNSLGHFTRVTNKLDRIKKVLTNCHYSVEFFNKWFDTDKFEFAYMPINPKPFTEEKKVYDIYYTGHFPCAISFSIPTMEKFNRCITSRTWGTHMNVPYLEKIKLNAQSRISIVHGLLLWPDPGTKAAFQHHRAFESLDKWPVVPQMKSRVFEAAMSKSLILYYRDEWNVIETYMEPGVDFLYWEHEKDLEEKVKHITANYDSYKPMIENAYRTVMNNYTTEEFFNTYLKTL